MGRLNGRKIETVRHDKWRDWMGDRSYKVYAEIQEAQDMGDTENGYVPVPRYWADDVTDAFRNRLPKCSAS